MVVIDDDPRDLKTTKLRRVGPRVGYGKKHAFGTLGERPGHGVAGAKRNGPAAKETTA